jgi:hypothetical protein
MVHTIHNLKTSNLNLCFEFQQLVVSLKHVINFLMQITALLFETKSHPKI